MSMIENCLHEINKNIGESPKDILFDAKNHRFGKADHAFYYGNQWDYKGQTYYSVNYGSWKMGEKHTWKSYSEKDASSKGFKNAYKKHTEDAQIAHDLDTQKRNLACKEKWLPIFKQANSQAHEYLKFKGISNPFTSRVDHRNTLMIPAYDHEGFVGVQRIFSDPESGKFEKRFSSGIKKKGSFCPLTPFKSAEIVYLTEGFATAASVQEIFPSIPVICAFDSGNLHPAINSIRFINPKCKIIIAADRDENKVGEKCAKKCVKSYPNVIYKMPVFASGNKEWTDFNDLAQFESGESVKNQLQPDDNDFFHVRFLGCSVSRKTFFYSSSKNKSVIELSAKDHASKQMMFTIAPQQWFVRNYGVEDEQTGKTVINWTGASDDFIQKSLEAGFWDKNNERGLGIWKEADTYVFNDGDKITPQVPVDKNFYTQTLGDYSVDFNKQCSLGDMQLLAGVMRSLSLKDKESHIYLLAWIIQSNILTTLPWKFHIWITGESSTGKSWIQDFLMDVIYNCKKFDNGSMAGMQAKVGNNATPFIFDESEPNKQVINNLLQFSREASNPEGASKLRSNSSQEIVEGRYFCTIAFGSIQLPKFEAQDRNRFFIVEAVNRAESGQTEEEFKRIQEVAEVLKHNKNALFARCFNRVNFILENQKIVFNHLKKTRSFKVIRTYMQLSVLIACYYEYLDEDYIDSEQIEAIMTEFKLDTSDYIQDTKTDQAEECLSALMSMEVDTYGQRTLASCLESIDKLSGRTSANGEVPASEFIRFIASHGIRYYQESRELFIANRSKKIMAKVKDFTDYCSVLKRNKVICVKEKDKQKVTGYDDSPVNGIRIRLQG